MFYFSKSNALRMLFLKRKQIANIFRICNIGFLFKAFSFPIEKRLQQFLFERNADAVFRVMGFQKGILFYMKFFELGVIAVFDSSPFGSKCYLFSNSKHIKYLAQLSKRIILNIWVSNARKAKPSPSRTEWQIFCRRHTFFIMSNPTKNTRAHRKSTPHFCPHLLWPDLSHRVLLKLLEKTNEFAHSF